MLSGADHSDGNLRFGDRVTEFRVLRGWSQRQLAAVSGLSPSTISRIEKGQRAATTMAVVSKIAESFGCTAADLSGAPSLEPDRSDDTRLVASLQSAFISTSLAPGTRPVRSWADTRADIDRVRVLRLRCEYRSCARLVAAVLTDAHAHAVTAAGRAALGQLCFDASLVARMVGDAATAWIAAERCRALSASTGSPSLSAAAAYAHAHVALACHAPSRARQVVDAAVVAASPPRSPEHAAIVGMLCLTGAVAAARLRPADRPAMMSYLASARALLPAAAGGADEYGLSFDAVHVWQWALALALECRDNAAAEEALAHIDARDIPTPARLAAYYVDLALFYSETARDAQAVRMLLRANQIAPEYRAHHSGVWAVIARVGRRNSSALVSAQLRRLQVDQMSN